MADLVSELVGIGRDYVRSQVRVTLESNLAPPITVYSGGMQTSTGGAAGLGKILGIRAGVVVRNAAGQELARFGQPSKPDPLRMALALLAVGAVGVLLWRMIR